MERVRLSFPAGDVVHRHPLTVRITDMHYGRHLGHDALVSLLREADGATVATARINLVLVDPQSGRPVAIPADVQDVLAGAT